MKCKRRFANGEVEATSEVPGSLWNDHRRRRLAVTALEEAACTVAT